MCTCIKVLCGFSRVWYFKGKFVKVLYVLLPLCKCYVYCNFYLDLVCARCTSLHAYYLNKDV